MKCLELNALMALAILFVICEGKYFPSDDSNNDDMELLGVDARSFLKMKPYHGLSKPASDYDCVLCKFNIVPCCKPNLCIKKRLQPDECLELRGRQKD